MGHLERVGVEYSQFPLHLSRQLSAELVDIEPSLFQLRRRKDADELAAIQKAIAPRRRCIPRPGNHSAGISELKCFNTLQATAVETLGECSRGPRQRLSMRLAWRATTPRTSRGRTASLHSRPGAGLPWLLCR